MYESTKLLVFNETTADSNPYMSFSIFRPLINENNHSENARDHHHNQLVKTEQR